MDKDKPNNTNTPEQKLNTENTEPLSGETTQDIGNTAIQAGMLDKEESDVFLEWQNNKFYEGLMEQPTATNDTPRVRDARIWSGITRDLDELEGPSRIGNK